MTTDTGSQERKPAQPGLPAPGISEADGKLDGFGMVIGSAEEEAAFQEWLDAFRHPERH